MARCSKCGYDTELVITNSWSLVVNRPAVSLNYVGIPGRTNYRYRRIKQEYWNALHEANFDIQVPRATAMRRVQFTRNFPKNLRPYDSDNLVGGFKPLRDCLTNQGLIVDDTPTWLQAFYDQIRADKDRIIITIEDILWTQ